LLFAQAKETQISGTANGVIIGKIKTALREIAKK
jgi:hypothetical protein